jgi:hypothetical protein
MPVRPIDFSVLYQVTTYSDGKGNTLEVRYPCDTAGDLDDTRPITYIGQYVIGIQTPQGLQQIPHAFSIEANCIEDAFLGWLSAGEKALETFESEMTRRAFMAGANQPLPKGIIQS